MKIGQKLYFAGLLFSALVAGCGSRGGQGEAGGGGGAGGGGQAGATEAQLRVAHLSPNAPRVDVCLLRERESVGPLMSSLLGTPKGLDYGEVTRYVRVPEGTYTLRLVEPGSRSCERGLAGVRDATGVELSGKSHYTVAAMGLLGQNAAVPFQLKALKDRLEPARERARLRFVHAAVAAPAVDVGVGEGATFRPFFTGVKFGQPGQEAEKDYVDADPIEDATLVLRTSGTTNDLATLDGFTLRAGEVSTVFAIGEPTNEERPLGALVCVDSHQATGSLAHCTRLKK
jgi:hypothetical protein